MHSRMSRKITEHFANMIFQSLFFAFRLLAGQSFILKTARSMKTARCLEKEKTRLQETRHKGTKKGGKTHPPVPKSQDIRSHPILVRDIPFGKNLIWTSIYLITDIVV